MEVILKGTAKEIAALVLAVQGRRDSGQTDGGDDREALRRECERRLARLKNGASPGDVIF